MRFEELVSVIVSFFFLLLRVGGSGKAFAEGAELGVGKGGGNIACRCHGVFKSRGKQGLLEGFLGVLLCNVAHFVAYNAKQFVVAHYVHQRREHAHTAVGTRESIDIDNIVHLEIQGYAFNRCKTLGERVEAFGIGAVGISHRVVLVHPVDIFLHILSHLLVSKCHGLSHAAQCFGSASEF